MELTGNKFVQILSAFYGQINSWVTTNMPFNSMATKNWILKIALRLNCVWKFPCKLIANKNIYRHVPTEILSYHTTKTNPNIKISLWRLKTKSKMNMQFVYKVEWKFQLPGDFTSTKLNYWRQWSNGCELRIKIQYCNQCEGKKIIFSHMLEIILCNIILKWPIKCTTWKRKKTKLADQE